MGLKKWLSAVCLMAFVPASDAQLIPGLNIHGNFQLDAQYYLEDSIIGAPVVPEKLLSNGFANFIFDKDNFSAGLRYESYLNPLLGFDQRYQGSGIPFRYLNYRNEELEVTVGSFYEQFGSGILLRAYEERSLGYDNALDGFRVKYKPYKGIYLKGLIGRQRSFFNTGEGIVRGIDAEWALNETFADSAQKKTQWILGGSFVSRYQSDQDAVFILPENVGSGSGRINFSRSGWTAGAEYAFKINDPSAANGFIYKDGSAFLFNAGYSRRGFGFTGGLKYIDNMNYRSDRYAVGNNLIMNYLPAMTKNHTYLLAALYPYATQPTGEFGFQLELFYKFKEKSFLGGKTGMDVNINYSRAQAIEKTAVDTLGNPSAADLGYESAFLKMGKEVYFEDFNVEIKKKLGKNTRMTLMYMYQNYNKDVVEGRTGFGHIFAHIGVAEFNFRITPKKNLRTELQHLLTEQDQKNWAVVLGEYSISPHWFVAAFDQYNYGNDDEDRRVHYLTVQAGYTRGANRLTFGYGRQRAGILCVGGICRNVPASSGFSLSITSSF